MNLLKLNNFSRTLNICCYKKDGKIGHENIGKIKFVD